MELAQIIKLARGAEPAEILLTNARIVNVYTGETYPAEIALADGRIAGIGTGYTARQVMDLGGRYVCPGFIDAHVHIESAMVPPYEFARAVVARGTTTVIIDPHEIANVLGLEGIRYIFDAAKYNPLSVYVMMPSCVPATDMETAGAYLRWYDISHYLSDPWVLGLGEMMNFPGVVFGDEEVLNKLRGFEEGIRDGHAPGLTGRDLVSYVAAGIGSDHESTTVEEMREKLRLGMVIFIREATNAHNLLSLIPGLTVANGPRVCFCTDDRQPADLLNEGHIDFLIRTAIAQGVSPFMAIAMATLNTSNYFRLFDRGGIAPGKRADLVVFSDLQNIRAEMVFRGGRLAAQDGKVIPWERPLKAPVLRSSMNINWERVNLRIPAQGRRGRIIGVIPGQLITEHLLEDLPIDAGEVVCDPGHDVAKIAVIERHQATGNFGLGLVRGIGLQRGAIASTVAHDSHNIIVVGVDDASIMNAAHGVADMRGGMVAIEGERVLARLPLPIAGLMSDQPIEAVRDQMEDLILAAHQLGSPLRDPFTAMSFLALPVIPSLKITDKGLVDVGRFQIVSLFE
ncbi:MAG: adenine deaminase [Acidobacteriia bacterium]|nr:adenine deaminase [Terriglobia bacterium]